MIISRTPFRISLFGGGTDYPICYKKNVGMTISATVNKYAYITARKLPPFFEYKYNHVYKKNLSIFRILPKFLQKLIRKNFKV